MCTNNELTNNKRFNPTLNSNSNFIFVYFFESGPFGVPKFVPEEVFGHTDSLGSVSVNICREAKNRIFCNGGVLAIWPKMTKF